MQQRRKGIIILLATLAMVITAVSAYLGRDSVSAWLLGDGCPLPRAPEFADERVDIASGAIQVTEFLQFLGDYTGLPIFYDASDTRFSRGTIGMAAPMQNVDAETVRAVLQANGFHVHREELSTGKQALRVTSTR